MMEPKQLMKQIIEFNKTTFDNSYNALVMLQEQMERMTGIFLEQATWLPKEGKQALTEWLKAYKKAAEEFKKTVDESFKKVEASLG